MENRKITFLSKFFDLVNIFENILMASSLIGLFCTIILQILGRVFAHPFPWTEETTRYLFIYMMFIALASGFNKSESSRVVIFLSFAPKFIKKFSKVLYAVIVTGFFLFMIAYGTQLVHQQITMNEKCTALPISMAFVGVCVPLSGILGIIGVIQSLLEYEDNIDIADKSTAEKSL